MCNCLDFNCINSQVRQDDAKILKGKKNEILSDRLGKDWRSDNKGSRSSILSGQLHFWHLDIGWYTNIFLFSFSLSKLIVGLLNLRIIVGV